MKTVRARPVEGDYRRVRKFAWWPRQITSEETERSITTVWLQWYYSIEQYLFYSYNEYGFRSGSWYSVATSLDPKWLPKGAVGRTVFGKY